MTYENTPNYVDEKLGTGISPKEFVVTEAKKMAICDCGQSSKLPFCDGTHTKL